MLYYWWSILSWYEKAIPSYNQILHATLNGFYATQTNKTMCPTSFCCSSSMVTDRIVQMMCNPQSKVLCINALASTKSFWWQPFHCLSTCMFFMDHLWRLTYWEINTHLQMTWKAKGSVFFLQYQNAFLLASTILMVMLVTVLLVCFASLFSKRELFRTRKMFLFHFEITFHSWDIKF